jgi:hypothetical protein
MHVLKQEMYVLAQTVVFRIVLNSTLSAVLIISKKAAREPHAWQHKPAEIQAVLEFYKEADKLQSRWDLGTGKYCLNEALSRLLCTESQAEGGDADASRQNAEILSSLLLPAEKIRHLSFMTYFGRLDEKYFNVEHSDDEEVVEEDGA